MTKTEKNTEWNIQLLGEALVFESLGRLLYEQLDKNWLQTLIGESVFEEVPFAGDQPESKLGLALLQKWSQENSTGISDSSFDALKVDNTRLFVGIHKVLAPLWESVYYSEDRLVFQEETLQVRSWYRRFGLEPDKLHQEPDDHIGLELLFVAHLAKLGLSALGQNDQPGFEDSLAAQRQFLSCHLLKWAPIWARSVIVNAQTDFYRGLAYLTNGALLETAALLELQLPKEVRL